MNDYVIARIQRDGVNNFRFIRPPFVGSAPITVALFRDQGGLVASRRPTGYGDLIKAHLIGGDLIECQYTNGEKYMATRMSDDSWRVRAPLPPPPTLNAIGNVERLHSTTFTLGLTHTITGPASWNVSKPSQIASASVINSGRSIQVRTGTAAGNFLITIRLTDQWGRSVSRSFYVYVPRVPTVGNFKAVSLDRGKSGNQKVNWTTDSRSSGWITTSSSSSSMVSATISGSGNNVRVNYRASSGKSGSATITVAVRDKWQQRVAKKFKVTVKQPPAAGWRWPFPRRAISWDEAGHGYNALDFGNPPALNGVAIPSIGPGTVSVNMWYGGNDLGWAIAIDHGNVSGWGRIQSLYGHLIRQSPLKVGTKVGKGTTIGHIGNTGNSQGAHVHLVILPNPRNGWGSSHIAPTAFFNAMKATHG